MSGVGTAIESQKELLLLAPLQSILPPEEEEYSKLIKG